MAEVQTKELPATAKTKKVNRYGIGTETINVKVQERTETWSEDVRIIDVWTEDGKYLGAIESDPDAQTSRPLYGNVAAFGKVYTAWHAGEGSYHFPQRSQAEAIRTLIFQSGDNN